MTLTADMLCAMLTERFGVMRLGRAGTDGDLPLPMFYRRGEALRDGALYVARSADLTGRLDAKCMVVCCGARPANTARGGRADLVCVLDDTVDIMTLFNFVQGVFMRVGDWLMQMQAILDRREGVESMIRASIPIFENRISVTDYALRVIAQCEVVERDGEKRVEMTDHFEHIPVEIARRFDAQRRERERRREPYVVNAQRGGSDALVDNYCINLFIDNVYAGVCTLCEDLKPLKPSDQMLFQVFARYLERALSTQQLLDSKRIIPLKGVLGDLLENYPVAESDLNQALAMLYRGAGRDASKPGTWCAAVVQSANRDKTLPTDYICATLEELMPNCFAIGRGDHVALIVLLDEGEDVRARMERALKPYLTDMHFMAGVSSSFTDLFKARRYYQQALVLLETGARYHQDENLFMFRDEILRYMLKNSAGILDREQVLTDGLRALRAHAGSVDYWETLKGYLDTECNASQTAQNLFLHRSTLLQRLETIQQYVSLETPAERLYLRMCLWLFDETDWRE